MLISQRAAYETCSVTCNLGTNTKPSKKNMYGKKISKCGNNK